MNKNTGFISVWSSMLCKELIPKTFIYPHHGKLGYCIDISWPSFYSSTNDNSKRKESVSVSGVQIDLFGMGFGKMFAAGRTRSRLLHIPRGQGWLPRLWHDRLRGVQERPSLADGATISLGITQGHLWSGREEVRSWQSHYGCRGNVLCPPCPSRAEQGEYADAA